MNIDTLYDWVRMEPRAATAEIERLREALFRIAYQDAAGGEQFDPIKIAIAALERPAVGKSEGQK